VRTEVKYHVSGSVAGLTGLVFAIFALPGFLGVFAPGKGGAVGVMFSAAIVVVCVVLSIRGFRSGIVVDATRVTCRSLLRTKRWPRPTVERFELRAGRAGAAAYRRLVLWIVLADGHDVRSEVLNWSPKAEASATLVVSELNRRVAA
jgi:hypothetical protein